MPQRSSIMGVIRWAAVLGLACVVGSAFVQASSASGSAAAAAAAAPNLGLWDLFRQSFDLFTVLLIAGSVVSVAVIISCVIDLREKNIVPARSVERMDELSRAGKFAELSEFARNDESMVARVVRAACDAGKDADRSTLREAAELAASEESARWFRKIDPLNVIGNLGPLIGLAGTVWGMILAFTSLGEAGGQADPTRLSLGISKALFHTLLGLCLAIPSLLAFGLYRGVVDRLCTRAMVAASAIIERLPARDAGGRG